ncbi:hypothetical protein Q8W71_22640 [Methylobacterium sp. NEAU 140]|uniref:hypothetical protein n=1 Tax=Methylobacterium sp. NEAU 140 TaxID=3064945 RepID=UPI002736FC9B|nr:hypothetical protein [Methylobacterium sp. NEAU 140]MDP4025434.1 hypothetical protein [Methylobacterium sp. NEAU 140]
MRSSECCVFRVIGAAFLGSGIVLATLWAHGPVRAMILAPVGGSLAAAAIVSLLYAAGRFAAHPAPEA